MSSSPVSRSERLRLRRGIALLVMTLVVPGSAQLAAGHRRVGIWAVRAWLGCLAAALGLVLLGLVSRGALLTVLTAGPTPVLLAIALVVLTIGWAGLFVDAWRIANPPSLRRQHRPGFALAALVLALSVSLVGIGAATTVTTQAAALNRVLGGGGSSEATDGRINVLLLGGDAGKTRVGLRPDSMTVASVDTTTGDTTLFSLPRNMQDAPIPATSPLRTLYPGGTFTCPGSDCLLNGVYTKASEHARLWPGVRDAGAEATREVVSEITGLPINYYAMIDLQGFKDLIDAVGGIHVDINKRIPVGGGSTKISRYLEPGRNVHLDGHNALWFARSRHGDNDYERMARQKCVMNAMLHQLDPATVVTRFNAIATAGSQIVRTDVPAGDVDLLIDLAMKARQRKIKSVIFGPPLVNPSAPDYAKVRELVRSRIAPASERPAAATPSSATKEPAKAESSAQPEKSEQQKAAERDDVTDLGAVCSAA